MHGPAAGGARGPAGRAEDGVGGVELFSSAGAGETLGARGVGAALTGQTSLESSLEETLELLAGA